MDPFPHNIPIPSGFLYSTSKVHHRSRHFTLDVPPRPSTSLGDEDTDFFDAAINNVNLEELETFIQQLERPIEKRTTGPGDGRFVEVQRGANGLRAPNRHTNNQQGRQCEICSNTNHTRATRWGAIHCINCRDFLIRAQRRRTNNCHTGNWDCDLRHVPKSVQWATGVYICSGCRLKRAIDLGLEPSSSTLDWLRDNNLQRTPAVRQPATEPESPEIQETPPASSASSNGRLSEDNNDRILAIDSDNLFIEDDDSPSADNNDLWVENDSPVRHNQFEDDDIATKEAARQRTDSRASIQAIRSDDLEASEDELGLPVDLESRFGRWFYADMGFLKPGSTALKSKEEEILIEPKVRVLTFCNDIGGRKPPLLTQNMNLSERPPVEELTTQVIQLHPSSTLRNVDSQKALYDISESRRRRRPTMNLKLETKRTIIDRRPMLKKLKTSNPCRNYFDTGEVSSSSLIGPGEDCDADDEIEVVVIDSD